MKVSVIIPSFHSKDLTSICVRSFEKFKPNDLDIHYIIIENSEDISYKNCFDDVVSLTWINNKTEYTGSEANAEAIRVGLDYVDSEAVFLVHCDTCVTSSLFFDNMMQKYRQGNKLIGVQLDSHPDRIKAFHVSCIMVETELSKSVNYMPQYINGKQILDVGDELTQYCRKNHVDHFCFDNTYNKENSGIDGKYGCFSVARCYVGSNVIFMHLGRGIEKTRKTYMNKNKINIDQWVNFCNKIIDGYL